MIITLEEHSIFGGLGSAVAECIAENGKSTKFFRTGLDCIAIGSGNRNDMREINGISYKNIINIIESNL